MNEGLESSKGLGFCVYGLGISLLRELGLLGLGFGGFRVLRIACEEHGR